MNGKIKFHFAASFFMGVLSGAFIYVTVFAPEYKKDLDTPEQVAANGVVIEGQMYGACDDADSCASFRLLQNRSFSYLPYPDVAVENGKLPVDIAKPLFEAIEEGTLLPLADEGTAVGCASDSDGLDFSYTISFEEESYLLDTCGTKLEGAGEAQALFINAWNFMQNPTTTYPAILEKGIGEYFIDRFEQAGEVE
jgi:hypothetical protein